MMLTKAERETIVRFSEDPEDVLILETFRWKNAEKLLQAGATLRHVRRHDGKEVAWSLSMPREWFKWPRKPRKVSEEHRRMAGERLKALHRDGKLKGNPA